MDERGWEGVPYRTQARGIASLYLVGTYAQDVHTHPHTPRPLYLAVVVRRTGF